MDVSQNGDDINFPSAQTDVNPEMGDLAVDGEDIWDVGLVGREWLAGGKYHFVPH